MPKDADILTVQVQDDKICIWARVNPTASLEKRTFIVFGTGSDIEEHDNMFLCYLGTVQKQFYVWHVYENMKTGEE